MPQAQPSPSPHNRPNWRLLLLCGLTLCGLYPFLTAPQQGAIQPTRPSALLQLSAMTAAYSPDGNTQDSAALMSIGSPALNEAFNSARRLEKLADSSGEPASQALLRELSVGLYRLSVAQAGYEYLNGNEALGELIHAAQGDPVPDSPEAAVKNVKTWRDRTLQSLHKLDTHPELPTGLKAKAQAMALEVIQRTNQQYGSMLR